MVKKRFEAEIPDGTRLDRSRDTAGAFRATIRDDGNLWFPPNRGGFGYAASPAGTAVLVS